jgi:putative membrane protein
MQRSETPAGPERSLHLRFGRLPRVSPGASARALLAGAAAVGVCGIPVVSLLPIGPLSAHMVHHIGLMSVLAPLSAVALVPLVQERMERLRAGRGAVLWTAACAQMALLWAWHAPPLHAATASGAAYGAVLASLYVAALCFWGGILLLSDRSRWQGIVALLVTGKLACLLGALLIFAPRPLYAHTAGHAAAHGLQDQQVAGLLMVVACPLSYVLVGVVLSAQLMYGLAAQTGRPAQPSVPANHQVR